jgi:hypothetical protein
MLDVVIAVVVVVFVGILAFLQAYFIGKCFSVGQPQESGHYQDCLL